MDSMIDIMRPYADWLYRPGYRVVEYIEGVQYILVYSSDTVYRKDI